MPVKTSLKENISLALQSIAGNRLRTSLTALIIAIGIMALVGILTAIDGIKNNLNDAFGNLGANSFTLQNRGEGLNFGGGGHRKVYPSITYEQAARFKEVFKLPVTTSINLSVTGTAVAKYGNLKTNPNISVSGSDENYLVTSGQKIGYGRDFSISELQHGDNVVMIGEDIRKRLFKNEDPINKLIFIGNFKFRIVGVFASKGSSSGFGGDKFCVIPVLKAKQMDTLKDISFNITVKTANPDVLDATIGEATSAFRNIRGLNISQADNFEISRSDSVQKELANNMATMTFGGALIAAVTLIGASIALMNIMLVSVTERTREIGVRKAIGANPRIIRKQFLIEAVVICLIGGLTGVFLGIIAGNAVVLLIGGSFIMPWLSFTAALIVCSMIGLISGYYPARKASRLDPVEALRYE
ncbi:MAG: ABC transporter permease [Bacteroidetes bacterium]|jgi:putative ABC transport system permease protein|nr:ABC transporter permease [Bacteroidota bacterium]